MNKYDKEAIEKLFNERKRIIKEIKDIAKQVIDESEKVLNRPPRTSS